MIRYIMIIYYCHAHIPACMATATVPYDSLFACQLAGKMSELSARQNGSFVETECKEEWRVK